MHTRTVVIDEHTRILYKDYEIDLDKVIKTFGKRAIYRDSNGVPINKNDIVYGLKDGKGWLVKDIISGSYPIDAIGCECIDGVVTYCSDKRQLKPKWLTHTPPDTQEKINRDTKKNPQDYWECTDYYRYPHCKGCEMDEDCRVEQMLDLLLRQRELDKRMMNQEKK